MGGWLVVVSRSQCSRLTLPFLNTLIYELGCIHLDTRGACRAFDSIFTSNLRPNVISYNSLLAALTRDANATVPLPTSTSEKTSTGSRYCSGLLTSIVGATGLTAALQGTLCSTGGCNRLVC
jgi:hypothetical protein